MNDIDLWHDIEVVEKIIKGLKDIGKFWAVKSWEKEHARLMAEMKARYL